MSTARPRGEACRPGRGRGRSGAVGGGRTRLEVPHGDPARPSRPPREARWTRGGPAAMPREPRKCLLRAGWRRDDRAGRERRTRGGLDAPSPGLLARCAARSRSGTLGRATAPPQCAPWRVRVCRVPLRSGCDIGSYKNLLQRAASEEKRAHRERRPFSLSLFFVARKRKLPLAERRKVVDTHLSKFRMFLQSENSSALFTDSRIVVTAFSVKKKIFGRNRA